MLAARSWLPILTTTFASNLNKFPWGLALGSYYIVYSPNRACSMWLWPNKGSVSDRQLSLLSTPAKTKEFRKGIIDIDVVYTPLYPDGKVGRRRALQPQQDVPSRWPIKQMRNTLFSKIFIFPESSSGDGFSFRSRFRVSGGRGSWSVLFWRVVF